MELNESSSFNHRGEVVLIQQINEITSSFVDIVIFAGFINDEGKVHGKNMKQYWLTRGELTYELDINVKNNMLVGIVEMT